MRIEYGHGENYVDITDLCRSKFRTNDNRIVLPSTERLRGQYFTDPCLGVHKNIRISWDNGDITEYDEDQHVSIDCSDPSNPHVVAHSETDVCQKLASIHASRTMVHENLQYELVEQRMAARFLRGNETVLEIGGNVGRNSLLIASILTTPSNLVVFESDPRTVEMLVQNRDANDLGFRIEAAALSKHRMIQRGWLTKPSDVLEEGWEWVNTVTLDELKTRHALRFDTLALDCEGAFYYILRDFPDILDNIQLILMENDYLDPSHKEYVDRILLGHDFRAVYVEGLYGQHDFTPEIGDRFFEVWQRFKNEQN